ncbi:hypothetical protein FRB97_007868 [Tulasnella sp. 331]|nr:hypothetical protein FRB97_007868 [Tulasnella sp. 331]
MKFGKSYYTATTSLPEEWRQRAIDYKQLKKLINRVVLELEHLGLNPAVLQRLLTDAPIGASNRETILDQTSTSSRAEDTQIVTTEEVEFDFPWGSGVIYEIDRSKIRPGYLEDDLPTSDERLRRFMDGIVRRGYTDRRHMRISSSREALDRFCALNVLLLDLKKFQQANLEATRKILKKHQKRTSLPSSVVLPSLSLTTRRSETLPHAILLTMTQTLLPIIPSIDDYQCLICTSIAFKPIRLACGHLFCVRCLVKMQRKGSPEYGNCPLCRAPTVFQADRSNLDVALMNFMEDWFPMEIKVKVKENADEVAREMARDLGMDGVNCIVM